VFIIYALDESYPIEEKVRILSDLLRIRSIDCEIDQYYKNKEIPVWPLWIQKQIEMCVAHKGRILLLCSPIMKLLLEETFDNHSIHMSNSSIDCHALGSLMRQHADHFVPVCITPETNTVPPSLSQQTIYKIPINDLQDDKTIDEILNDTRFTFLKTLINTLTNQQEIEKPEIGKKQLAM